MPDRDSIYYDRQEVRSRAEREASTCHALPGLIRHALDNAPALAALLAGIEPDDVTSMEALAALPLLRRADLARMQRENPPFGGLSATPQGRLARLFASPGPVYEPEGARTDYWRLARAMFAAGFRRADLVYNAFPHHLQPAGAMAENGARALGCPVIPAGPGAGKAELRALGDLRPSALVGAPSALLALMERARAAGVGIDCIERTIVAGEAFPQPMRRRFADEFGIRALYCYVTPDLGLVAYESWDGEGLICDESIIVEIVDPDTGKLVNEGEAGEVVVTAFNPDYPLIRFATGDIAAMMPGESPCGRTNARLTGLLGRVEDSLHIAGGYVTPAVLRDIVARHQALRRALLVVDRSNGRDRLVLHCEVDGAADGLAQAIAATAHAAIGVAATVELVAPGTIPVDGRLIDDRRPPA